MIDVFLLSKPTPTIGAPPTLTPGEPKAPLLLPVVCVPPMVEEFVPPTPFVAVPPIPVEEPKPLPELELVPPMGEVLELPLPKAEPEDPPNDEVDDPAPKDEPLLPKEDPEAPEGELLPSEKPEEFEDALPPPNEDPVEPVDVGEPKPLLEAEPFPFVAPVGVIPVRGRGWPNKPMDGTLASPRWMMRQSSFPVMGSR